MSTVDKARLGVITPLYVSPQQNLPAWIMLASVARRYPRVHTIAVVDVSRGPGLGPDPMYQHNISMLKENGVTVLGYVETNDEGDRIEDIQEKMKNWRNWYSDIDGFYFAHVPRSDDVILKYEGLLDYAKDYLESKFVAAEFEKEYKPILPRQFIISSNIDLFVSYRDRNVPAPLHTLKGGIEDQYYPTHKFGVILTKLPVTAHSQRMTENFIRQAVTNNIARYFYFHTDDGAREMHPEPFTKLSEFFEVTVRDLDNIASNQAVDNVIQNAMIPATTFVSKELSETTKTEQPLYDKFDVEMIYDDVYGKSVSWYFKQDEGNPDKDPQFRTVNSDTVVRRMQDGSKDTFYVNSKKGPSILEIKAPYDSVKQKRFLNTETTLFFKYLGDKNTNNDDYAIQVFNRVQDGTEKCAGSSYAAGILKSDGRTAFQKYITTKYACPLRGTQPAVTAHSVVKQWIGFKSVVYNIKEEEKGDTVVVMETYICQNCTTKEGTLTLNNQKWDRTSKFVDRPGYWGLDDPKLEKKVKSLRCKSIKNSTDVITEPGSSMFVIAANEGAEVVVTNMSVREIKVEQTD